MNVLVVEFLTRSGCHICEEALPHVEKAARRAGIAVRTLDIDTDDQLLGVYGLRIPVVLGPDGAVLAEGPIAKPGELTPVFRKLRRVATGRRQLLRRR